MRRRKKGCGCGCLGTIVSLILIAAIYYISTFTLTVTGEKIYSDKINDEITIVAISDLHGATFGKDNGALIKKIEQQNPDIIVALGDMYTAGDERGKQTALALLGDLAQRYDVYFVTGEHDNERLFFEQLTERGVQVLDYKATTLTFGSTTIGLYGIDNMYYTDSFDLTGTFELDPGAFNVLLAHQSYFAAFRRAGFDLSLSGDTHGGQVRLPFLGPIIHDGHWFPKLTYSRLLYDKGLFSHESQYLFVTSGLGNYPYPLRLFNRPEVAVITLLPA